MWKCDICKKPTSHDRYEMNGILYKTVGCAHIAMLQIVEPRQMLESKVLENRKETHDEWKLRVGYVDRHKMQTNSDGTYEIIEDHAGVKWWAEHGQHKDN